MTGHNDISAGTEYADLVRELHQAATHYSNGHGPLHASAANAIEHLSTLLRSGAPAQSVGMRAADLAKIEAEARRYAGMYPEASDGRNTFVIFADWVARIAAQPTAAPVEAGSIANIANNCRAAAKTWREEMPRSASCEPESIAAIYDRIANSIDCALDAAGPRSTVTVIIPEGYDSARDFLDDCGLEAVVGPNTQMTDFEDNSGDDSPSRSSAATDAPISLRAVLETAREEIVLAVAFLGRDLYSARLNGTADSLVTRLAKVDADIRAALATDGALTEPQGALKPLPVEAIRAAIEVVASKITKLSWSRDECRIKGQQVYVDNLTSQIDTWAAHHDALTALVVTRPQSGGAA